LIFQTGQRIRNMGFRSKVASSVLTKPKADDDKFNSMIKKGQS